MFNFFPESVYLSADDGSVELPDEDGCFPVDAMNLSFLWTCDGDSCKPSRPADGDNYGTQHGPSGLQWEHGECRGLGAHQILPGLSALRCVLFRILSSRSGSVFQ